VSVEEDDAGRVARPTKGKPPLRVVQPGDLAEPEWRDRLLWTGGKSPKIIGCIANAVTILRNDEPWLGVLAWDDFRQSIACRKPPPWCDDDARSSGYDHATAWADTDGHRVSNWLRRRWSLNVSARDAYMAALMVAEANSFDPLVDWVRALEWDGVRRVDAWFATYLGVEAGPYSAFVGRAMLVSAIARALVPGAKVDTMTILEGPQGIWKSQSCEALFGREWYSETPLDLSSKDRFVGLRGLWCHEMAELDTMGKADASRVKSFLSSPWDKYRPPYGAHDVRVARRCVMVGTVNPGPLGYLVDVTGNRRMWPVRCGVMRAIDLDGIHRDRAQLWAEAREMFETDPRWWPVTPDEQRLCNEEQESRMTHDVWIGKVETWLRMQRSGTDSRVTVRDVLIDCLGIEVAKHDRANAARVGNCLAQCGWELAGREGGGTRERYYRRIT